MNGTNVDYNEDVKAGAHLVVRIYYPHCTSMYSILVSSASPAHVCADAFEAPVEHEHGYFDTLICIMFGVDIDRRVRRRRVSQANVAGKTAPVDPKDKKNH